MLPAVKSRYVPIMTSTTAMKNIITAATGFSVKTAMA